MVKNIVILGGSYNGISTAHRILKQASKAPKAGTIKVTMVSPNTDIYWNIASPRAATGVYGDDKIFQPIAPGFAQYGAGFELVVGTAEGLDVEAKTVQVRLAAAGGAEGRRVGYDFLVLATGSRTKEITPFKGVGSTEETKGALRAFRDKVRSADSIVIAGGGVTGIEFAGEVAFEFGKQKTVHLIAKGPALSSESPPSVQQFALNSLTALGVDVKLNTTVTYTSVGLTGDTTVTLSDGSSLTVDLYVPTYGLVPNSSYIPAKFLNSNGAVAVDEYLKVKGAGDVWAIGDVADIEWKQILPGDKQSACVAKNIVLTLGNKPPIPYQATTDSGRVLGFSIGPKNGTGSFGSWKIPSFVISYVRKELFIQRLDPLVSGTAF